VAEERVIFVRCGGSSLLLRQPNKLAAKFKKIVELLPIDEQTQKLCSDLPRPWLDGKKHTP
jgi:hypothetical protein